MSGVTIFALAIGASLDSFAVSIRKGAMFARIKHLLLFAFGLSLGCWQAFVLLLGNSITITDFFSPTSINLQVLIEFLAVLIFIGAGIYMLGKGINARAINEVRVDELDQKSIFIFTGVHSIEFFLIGIALGFIHIDLSLSIMLPIVLINGLALILGVYTGYYFGYEQRSKAYKIGGTIFIIMGVYVFLEYVLAII